MFSIGLTKRIKEHTIELNRNNYVLWRKWRRNHKVKGGGQSTTTAPHDRSLESWKKNTDRIRSAGSAKHTI
ncbi:hypothetical protein [Bacillus atrophaeus]|uniref:hypothetical protein n=1 Tax=Bacillus atrophaeus TaxID=1452 RepID=UPI001C121EDF|nr:hypothetical protein [Bacillus atrophaeus]MBU5261229.1 hypothetical protein [Bacillus atrophaeus]